MHLFVQTDSSRLFLEGEEARHCARVLRLRPGDRIALTDGQGTKMVALLKSVNPEKCEYNVERRQVLPPAAFQINMAVCPTRKAERNEWMVEKMTEIGVAEINFVVSEHTHHETINRVLNMDRLGRIAQSAMKQSQQYYLPKMAVFPSLAGYLGAVESTQKFIAHLTEEKIPQHLLTEITKSQPVSVLIGPEGDFSKNEIEAAMAAGLTPVSLGPHRLRTETAAVAACHAANLAQIL